ncbi:MULTISPECIES: serine hydrolase domain-containing protein [Sphingobacterium]|uniref:serine hydrolase domain-containing protein n=1 Tax=Sphingobacterium TaxID=28453 RepID=UPI001053C95F|nr:MULTISPECIES: serine hydrolase domain-containing protein [Sphingobacterium]MCW2263652.1 CubicO group peptidase (beta-lactamase class C family) [Sphingobacterium kitahiroshimense]TCR03870.1 CubicO group peptidase (beta-lactamase class C family) [Sphingobacterium sp. JUb78]
MKKYVPLLLIYLFLISPITWAQTNSLDKKITDIMAQYEAIGLSVAVIKNNELFFNKSYGLKNREQAQPLDQDDLFRIASISKSFSATAIMQLIEQKKCHLDDDFGDLIGFKVQNPKFPNKKITLRMVLSHTSSINDKNGYFDLDVINPSKSDQYASSYSPNEPGTTYDYCNLNFNMVGAVIERLSGQRFDQYIKEHILDPLQLYAGYCVDSLDQNKFVTLYEYDSAKHEFFPQPSAYNPRSLEIKNYTLGHSTPIFSPTGGMKISAVDLAKYMGMHMNYGTGLNGKQIIKKRNSKIMQTPITAEEGYGLALRSINTLIPNKVLIGHTGSAYGLYSAMFFDPKEKFGIVVITNGCRTPENVDFNPLLKDCIQLIYKEMIQQ